jgi:hypothetical protein
MVRPRSTPISVVIPTLASQAPSSHYGEPGISDAFLTAKSEADLRAQIDAELLIMQSVILRNLDTKMASWWEAGRRSS